MRRKILSEEIQKHLQPLESRIEELKDEVAACKAETELYRQEVQKAMPTVSAEDLILKLNTVLTQLRNDTYFLNVDNFDEIKARQAKLWGTFDTILKSCNINVYYIEPGSFVGDVANNEEFRRWNVLSETTVSGRRLNTVKQCYGMTIEPAGGRLFMGEVGVYRSDAFAGEGIGIMKDTSFDGSKPSEYKRPDAENVTHVRILPENSSVTVGESRRQNTSVIPEEKPQTVVVETVSVPAAVNDNSGAPQIDADVELSQSINDTQLLNTQLYSSTGVYPFNSGRDFTIVRDRKKPATIKFEKSAESRGLVKYSDNKLVSVFNASKFLGEYYNLGKVREISVVSVCGNEFRFPQSADVSAQAVYKYAVEDGLLYLHLCVRVWNDAGKGFDYGDVYVIKLAKVD